MGSFSICIFFSFVYSLGMSEENRNATRYDDIGRIVCEEICPLPGVLDNISRTGCKVHFPVVLDIDLEGENEYEVSVMLPKKNTESPLKLMCLVQWVKQCENSTELGLKFLFSPDSNRFAEYIEDLEQAEKDSELDIV